MKHFFLHTLAAAALAWLPLGAGAQDFSVTFSGNDRDVWQETPAANTGLNRLFVLHNVQGVSMHFTANSATSNVTWYSYGESGGALPTLLSDVTRNGAVTTLPQVKGNCGYIIEEESDETIQRTYVWVVDYSAFPLAINAITFGEMGDCGTATLNVDGSGEDIDYYTITGVRRVLSRELTLSFNNLVWSGDSQTDGDGDNDGFIDGYEPDDEGNTQENTQDQGEWKETPQSETYEGFKPVIVLAAPFCNTTYTLTGDRFLQFWGLPMATATSDTYHTIAVDAHCTATQEERNNDNEQKNPDASMLGGSAPATITFKAVCTDAVIYKEWQMATDPDFNDIDLRLNQDEVVQTFVDEGTTYWRFIGANDDNSCETVSQTFTVSIGISDLVCPNVFTPGVSEGVNDVWKVSYRSITEFHCWIFNRWGNKIIELNDPSQGWDGTYGGKLVKPGVYYYVIEARGADGKKYKKSGDINIIRYKKDITPTTDDDGTGGGGTGIETE